MPSHIISPIGQTFGKLKVIRYIDKTKDYRQRYLFCCECGNEKIIQLRSVTSGHTKSCGCDKVEHGKRMLTTHGMYSVEESNISKLMPLYDTWRGMIYRCFTETSKIYKYYGGRGITVCEEWLDFYNFCNDMGERPENTTLDRINNDGNYEPSNCRWATDEMQAQNRRMYLR